MFSHSRMSAGGWCSNRKSVTGQFGVYARNDEHRRAYDYNVIHISTEFVQKIMKRISVGTLWAELADCKQQHFCSPILRVASLESTTFYETLVEMKVGHASVFPQVEKRNTDLDAVFKRNNKRQLHQRDEFTNFSARQSWRVVVNCHSNELC